MTGLIGGAHLLQPWVHCHGRLQQAHMILSLRQFSHSGPAVPATQSLPVCPKAAQSIGAASQHSVRLQAASPWQQTPRRRPRQQQQQQHGHPAWPSQAAPQSLPYTSTAAAVRTIQPGEVHIWWLDPTKVGGEQELQRCRQLITSDELHDCDASDEPAVRRERLLARALVRSVLADYLPGNLHPRTLVFGRNGFGKPHLLWPCAAPGTHQLRFNLTHTDSLIGLALTADCQVGLDVECEERRTRGDPLRLARRRFSEQEVADMAACPDEASKAAHFLRLWTLKEAYVKALGRGISAPPGLRSFSFRLGRWKQPALEQQELLQQQEGQNQGQDGGLGPQHLSPWQQYAASPAVSTAGAGSGSDVPSWIEFQTSVPEPRHWQFALLRPAPGHLAALCVECTCEAQHQVEDLPAAAAVAAASQQTGALRLLCFNAQLFGAGHLMEAQILAEGVYPSA